VSSVRRIADKLPDRPAGAAVRQWFSEQLQSVHQYTEQVLGSSALNISTGVDKLLAALSAASESPESSAPRQQIVSAATALAGRYNQLAVSLDNQERQLADQLATSVEQLNSTTTQVAKLNQQITELSARGGNVSQLEDQRDQSLRDLAKLVDIQGQPHG
jgi:flagellar hook-associated protein 1 FlgK